MPNMMAALPNTGLYSAQRLCSTPQFGWSPSPMPELRAVVVVGTDGACRSWLVRVLVGADGACRSWLVRVLVGADGADWTLLCTELRCVHRCCRGAVCRHRTHYWVTWSHRRPQSVRCHAPQHHLSTNEVTDLHAVAVFRWNCVVSWLLYLSWRVYGKTLSQNALPDVKWMNRMGYPSFIQDVTWTYGDGAGKTIEENSSISPSSKCASCH